jgi:hypothetical protein
MNMNRKDQALEFAFNKDRTLLDLFQTFFGESEDSPGESRAHIPTLSSLLGTTSSAAIVSALVEPTVTTDKDDYAPGEDATITASGFEAGATVTFEVDHVSDEGADGAYGTADDTTIDLGGEGHDAWTVTDGGEGDLDGEANGTIVTTWHVNPDDSADERFLVTASDGESTATNTFTDALPTDSSVDLTETGGEGFVNGAFFTNDAQGAGTGVIDSFVRISTNQSVEEGYNTSDRPLEFDENSSPNFTRDLLFSDIPIIFLDPDGDGTFEAFLEFQLDINEPNTASAKFLSLDEIEIYVSENQIVTGTYDGVNFGGTATKVYELDSGGADNWIALNYGLQAGSGVSDMIMYVPLADFAGVEADDFVTFYSEFGVQGVDSSTAITFDWTNNSGFEEWAVREFILKSGVKYHDLNADGVRDEDGVDNILGNADDEVGLAGWTIYIDANGNDQLDAGEISVVTDADGFYQFSLFEAGTYTFREVQQADWFQSAPAGGEYTENLALGDRSFDNDFGNFQKATITGVKYEDQNADGDEDAEDTNPIAGIVINLYDDSGSVSGDLDGGDVLLDSTTTAADGTWSFGDLDPGAYNVEEVLSGTGYKSNDTTDFFVELTSGETYGVNDDTTFLNYAPAEITGVKYEDQNADGDEDAEDTNPIAGIVINLYDDSGSVSGDLDGGDVLLDSTTTAADGTWSFGDLDPGAYNVEEVLAGTGYKSNDDTDFFVELTSGETYGVNDDTTFLNYAPAEIQGIKLEDLNQNGDHDLGEDTPIAGIVINLYDDSGSVTGDLDGGDVLLDSTATAADGTWSFGDLDPGAYNVEEVLSGGYQSNDETDFFVDLTSGETYGVNDDTTFMNFVPNPPSGQTPGFWKNHLDIYFQELGDGGISADANTLYEDVFLVDLTGDLDGITLVEALNLGGGEFDGVVRHSAAALANAASDDLNFSFAGFAAGAIRDTLELIDLDDNTILSPDEVINVVQDLLDDADAVTDNFEFADSGEVLDALDAMNNLPHLDADMFT